MTYEFRPATREGAALLISLASGTGGGKTLSALLLARGLAGGDDSKVAFLDTEAGRGRHYAPANGDKPGPMTFGVHFADMVAPFTPDAYSEAITTADKAGYKVIIVDSASHEHAGEGGLLDMHEAEFQRMGHRDAVSVAAWVKPKAAHKKMVSKLLQVRAHVILCLRAEQKIEMVRDDKGKMQIIPARTRTGLDGWVPICEKNLPFEMTCSFLLTADKPGVPQPIKLQDQHRAAFPAGEPITVKCGEALAEWAGGGKKGKTAGSSTPKPDPAPDADILPQARNVAGQGAVPFKAWWKGLDGAQRAAIKPSMTEIQTICAKADTAGDDPFGGEGEKSDNGGELDFETMTRRAISDADNTDDIDAYMKASTEQIAALAKSDPDACDKLLAHIADRQLELRNQ